jgi:recombination protein RecR
MGMGELSPIAPMVEQLAKLPGVGPKSAQRLAFFILSMPLKEVEQFSSVIRDVRSKVGYCEQCFNLSLGRLCMICSSPKRDSSRLCVVSEPKGIYSIERTLEYTGLYHVLGGLISPLDGVQPESLRIPELLNRIKTSALSEIIFAINPTIEGEATVLYLSSLLRPFSIRITKLAYGLPIGADLEFADELTLQRALSARTVIE